MPSTASQTRCTLCCYFLAASWVGVQVYYAHAGYFLQSYKATLCVYLCVYLSVCACVRRCVFELSGFCYIFNFMIVYAIDCLMYAAVTAVWLTEICKAMRAAQSHPRSGQPTT